MKNFIVLIVNYIIKNLYYLYILFIYNTLFNTIYLVKAIYNGSNPWYYWVLGGSLFEGVQFLMLLGGSNFDVMVVHFLRLFNRNEEAVWGMKKRSMPL